MSEQRFIEQLKLITPTAEDLKRKGLPEELVDIVLEASACQPKTVEFPSILVQESVLRLLEAYDCTSLRIGLVRLTDCVSFVNFYQIGSVDADPLVLDKVTRKIEVRDYTNPSYVIWLCAHNGDNFLDALLICANAFFQIVLDKENNNEIFRAKNARLAAQKAGGDDCLLFYEMLFS